MKIPFYNKTNSRLNSKTIKSIVISCVILAIVLFVGFSYYKRDNLSHKPTNEEIGSEETDMNEDPRKSESDKKDTAKSSDDGNKQIKEHDKKDDDKSKTDSPKKDTEVDIPKEDPKKETDVDKPKENPNGEKQNEVPQSDSNQGKSDSPTPTPSPTDQKDTPSTPQTTKKPTPDPGQSQITPNPQGGSSPSDSNNTVSFIQTCDANFISIVKNIREILFVKLTQQVIDARYKNAKYKDIFKYYGKGNVKDWVEGSRLYVASPSVIYLTDNPNLEENKAISQRINGTPNLAYNYNFSGSDDNVHYQDCARFTNLEKIDFANINTSKLTYLGPMFSEAKKLKTIAHLTNFDTSKVENMTDMFFGCDSLTELDLSSFDTSKVKYMDGMLYGKSLKTIYVSNKWTTKNVIDPIDKDHHIFANNGVLVGGAGTKCTSTSRQADSAHIDGGPSNPGCLTLK